MNELQENKYRHYIKLIDEYYSNMEKISIAEFNKISKQINEEIASEKESVAVKQLYTKFRTPLYLFAQKYAENNGTKTLFLDALSACYLKLVEFITLKANTTWFANHNTYSSEICRLINKFTEDFINENAKTSIIKKNTKNEFVVIHEQLEHLDEQLPENSYELVTEMEKKALKRSLAKLLDSLTPREKQCIELYFGFSDSDPMSIRELAEYLNLSKTVIEKHIRKGIRKLHHPKRAVQIIDYIKD